MVVSAVVVFEVDDDSVIEEAVAFEKFFNTFNQSAKDLKFTSGVYHCKSCGELKKMSEFYTRKSNEAMISTSCKKCFSKAVYKAKKESL